MSLVTEFCGLRVYESTHLTIGPFEDWSRVRSPGRARRRRRKHRQNIQLYYLPDPNMLRTRDAIYGHPETVAKLRAAIPSLTKGSPDAG